MNKKGKQIEKYIDGWIKGDKEMILDSLSDDCEIIESHGPHYKGKEEVKQWLDDWLSDGSVENWDIYDYEETGKHAYFEWNFVCISKGKECRFNGITRVSFNSMDEIMYLREYRMTEPLWRVYGANPTKIPVGSEQD